MTSSMPKLSTSKLGVKGLFVANFPTVMIENFHLAKELLCKDEWCGRHTSYVSEYLRSDSGKNKVYLVQNIVSMETEIAGNH